MKELATFHHTLPNPYQFHLRKGWVGISGTLRLEHMARSVTPANDQARVEDLTLKKAQPMAVICNTPPEVCAALLWAGWNLLRQGLDRFLDG